MLIPLHQGVFSAFGLMTADMRVDESLTTSFRSDLDRSRARQRRRRASPRGRAAAHRGRGLRRHADCSRSPWRCATSGQNYGTDVPLALDGGRVGPAELEETLRTFAAEHQRLYGYDIPDEIVELVTFKTSAIGVDREARACRCSILGEPLVATGERAGLLPRRRLAADWRSTTVTRCPPARHCKARRSSRSACLRPSYIPASSSRSTSMAISSSGHAGDGHEHGADARRRPGDAAGRQQLPRHDGPRDGHRDAQHVLLAALQRGARLLVRDLRRRRRDDRPGGVLPRPPRRDHLRRRVDDPRDRQGELPSGRRRLSQRPLPRRLPPARVLRHQARLLGGRARRATPPASAT